MPSRPGGTSPVAAPPSTDRAFQARETLHIANRTVTRGEWIGADDPIVATHRAFLIPASEVIERATAAPGEHRNVHIPREES